MKYLLLLLTAVLTVSCATEPVSGGAGGAGCYRTRTSDYCKSCGNSGGVSCQTCSPRTYCFACSDVEGNGCWVNNVLVKCKSSCPSGSYMNGEKMP